MFVRAQELPDFNDTAAGSPTRALGQRADPIQLMTVIDEADRTLLRLVFCAAIATLLLALAASLVV